MTDAAPKQSNTLRLTRPLLPPLPKACRSPLPTRPLSPLLHPPSTQTDRTTWLPIQHHFSISRPCGTPSREARILSLGRGTLTCRTIHPSLANPRPLLRSLRKTHIPTILVILTATLISSPLHAGIRLKFFKLINQYSAELMT